MSLDFCCPLVTLQESPNQTSYDVWYRCSGIFGEDVPEPDDDETESTSWKMFENMMCFRFLYLFPKNYDFPKDDLIHLWVAQRFFFSKLVNLNKSVKMILKCSSNTYKRLQAQRFIPRPPPDFFPPPPFENIMEWEAEDLANLIFDIFQYYRIFQMSGLDHSTGRPRYKVENAIVDFLQEKHYGAYFQFENDKSYVSETTLYASLGNDTSGPITLKELYVAESLVTLLILHETGSCFNEVPRGLFLKLPLLRVLDFSHTNISELPSSIGNLKDLEYLNLSGTPITILPNSLCCLYQMQILKLRGCSKLLGLPEDIRKLTNLRHLDADVACLLVWIPRGLGGLTSLRTLPAFVVGNENGCHITELKHMAVLSGTLGILRLENVSNSNEAKEAALDQKKYINKLELQWTEFVDGLVLLENLRPHENLKELEIVGYGGVKFPGWIGDPIFSFLTILNIHDCIRCKVLPPLGKLPKLRCLSISGMHSIKAITGHFCGREMVAGPLGRLFLKDVTRTSRSGNKFTAFPQLRILTLRRMHMLKKWTGMEEADFPNLEELSISGCSRLTAVPDFSNLKSLQQLEISMCPSVEFSLKERLATSLQSVVITDCPLLKKQCREFGILAHVRSAWIDYQQLPNMNSISRRQVRLSDSKHIYNHLFLI
ncbi:protein-serine/threonine phosphatase [Ranunculus cassubicifolius]